MFVYRPAGSIYCDSELWKSGMIGEGMNTSSVLVVKTHSNEVCVYYNTAGQFSTLNSFSNSTSIAK